MKIANSILEFNKIRESLFGKIGFVPTMGALHEGHLSLVQESNNKCDHTIISIFINPKQFAPNEDFDNYPRKIDSDIEKLSSFDIDILFLPNSNEIYTDEYNGVDYNSYMFTILEGVTRPHFFTGVCDVVSRLFDIVNPTDAFFGEKDFQQLRVIENMVEVLNYNINIISCKIIREENGLAMSSRNKYLKLDYRYRARIIFETLNLGLKLVNNGEKNLTNLYQQLTAKLLLDPIITIDYIKVVDYKSLLEFSNIIDSKFSICIAVYIDDIRLIDNIYQ